ncbi:peptide ABC transporter substrate-binding protein [Virgibacillus profundi]|uniref:Peptide ABC transporter substrate-binding protein n=1 Tax=Virgibacillus profundi TaxID=2024555 RepID=A0A2A2II50_9BACI|nr:dipeptide ABC transporter ATP-binding protein [Virgibacillus profundi]PAV30783.1 peptide ABC transporter substrate-binding protein [Virgibacillus profundi]PXY54966.1 dipeptide ABC transporter ATP-binding protein [Virgibacillus profundi]
MVNQPPLLEVEKLKKYYPIKGGIIQRTISNVKAVHDVSLEVHEGETLGIVGESGCGKSTLGRTVLGLENLTEGSIRFRGDNIGGLSDRKLKKYKKDMQMIFQDPYASLNPRQRIGDALEEILIIHTKLSKKERRNRVQELLVEVGLKDEHFDRYPHEFSGGQRQRVGIARALAVNPSLIVCDEAVSALDVSVQAQIIKLLKELQSTHNLTYMFISHDLAVVRHMSDRVLVMYLGATAELGNSDQIYNNPLHPYTKALLSSIPRPIPGKKKERIQLVGDLPSASDYPSGCPFHTRCPIAKSHCAEVRPEWREVEEGHFVACHEV